MYDVRTLLKRDESYAIHALIKVAEQPGIGTAEIATQLEMPPAFMAKIVRKLVAGGYLEGRKGRKGGLYLERLAEDVSLLEIIESISGTLIVDHCQSYHKCSTQKKEGVCNLKIVWTKLTLKIRELLTNIKVAQISSGT